MTYLNYFKLFVIKLQVYFSLGVSSIFGANALLFLEAFSFWTIVGWIMALWRLPSTLEQAKARQKQFQVKLEATTGIKKLVLRLFFPIWICLPTSFFNCSGFLVVYRWLPLPVLILVFVFELFRFSLRNTRSDWFRFYLHLEASPTMGFGDYITVIRTTKTFFKKVVRSLFFLFFIIPVGLVERSNFSVHFYFLIIHMATLEQPIALALWLMVSLSMIVIGLFALLFPEGMKVFFFNNNQKLKDTFIGDASILVMKGIMNWVATSIHSFMHPVKAPDQKSMECLEKVGIINSSWIQIELDSAKAEKRAPNYKKIHAMNEECIQLCIKNSSFDTKKK